MFLGVGSLEEKPERTLLDEQRQHQQSCSTEGNCDAGTAVDNLASLLCLWLLLLY